MTSYRTTPKKGLYLNEGNTWKNFNNAVQTASGANSLMQQHDDPYCSDRFVFVTVTSLYDHTEVDMEFAVKDFGQDTLIQTISRSSLKSATPIKQFAH